MSISRDADVTVIGAGVVGIAAALYLQRAQCRVTVLDKSAPGEGCSFGNAGLISPGACVPFSMPNMIWRLPRYLTDPLGPLAIRWAYLPQALPWLLRFLAAGRPGRVRAISRAMAALHARAFEAYAPLLKEAGAEDLLRAAIKRSAFSALFLELKHSTSRRACAGSNPRFRTQTA